MEGATATAMRTSVMVSATAAAMEGVMAMDDATAIATAMVAMASASATAMEGAMVTQR